MGAADHAYIRTARLRLTPVTDGDPDEIAETLGNYDVARWLGRVPYPYGPADARAFIAANRDGAGRVWFIHDDAGLAGGIGIDDELGYWLARRAWGRGYATEAGDAVIDAHFADPAADMLRSNHFPGNERSANVLRKLGFRPAGTRAVRSLSLAQTVEAQALVLSREDWRARRDIRISTSRLALRPLCEADWPRLQELGGVPEVARMMVSLTVPWGERHVKHWVESSRFRGRPGYRLGLVRRGRLIGAVGLGHDRSVSYMVDRRHWGRGYATEAMAAFVADVFDRFPEIGALEADHFADNPASGAVLRKLGFVPTGTGIGASRARLEPAPNVLYRLDRDARKARPR